MVRPYGRYVIFRGRTFKRCGERYVHLGDLREWLLSRFGLHIRWARQAQADELDDVIEGLEDAEPEPTDDDD